MTEEVKNKAIVGVRWNLVNQILDQTTKLTSTIILARLLLPSDFGLIGMIVVILNFLNIFFEMGFGMALIQKDHVSDKDYHSIFTFNFALGILISAIVFFCAPLISVFYNNPELTSISRFLCFAVVFNSLAVVPNAIITRNIDFKKIMLANNVSLVVCLAIAIVLAILGYGVWAIAVQYVILALFKTITLFWLSFYKPKFQFSKKSLLEMLPYGLSITGNRTLDYWGRNADNLLIAKFLGEFYLGIYTRAYQIMLLPVRNISSVIAKVLFPVFSRQQRDKEMISRYYLVTTRVVSSITFPLMMALFLVAEEFVLLVFGPEWIAMAPALQIMCFLGMIQSIQTFNGTIYNSLNKAGLAFRLGLIFKSVFVIGFIVGIYFGGFMGLIYGYLAASLINLVPNLFYSLRLIGLTPFSLLKNISANFFISLFFMVITYLIFRYIIYDFSNLFISLISKLLLFSILYSITIYIVDPESIKKIGLLLSKKERAKQKISST